MRIHKRGANLATGHTLCNLVITEAYPGEQVRKKWATVDCPDCLVSRPFNAPGIRASLPKPGAPKMGVDLAIDLADEADLPDGAWWAYVSDLTGLEADEIAEHLTGGVSDGSG